MPTALTMVSRFFLKKYVHSFKPKPVRETKKQDKKKKGTNETIQGIDLTFHNSQTYHPFYC